MVDFPYSERKTNAFLITPSATVPVQGPKNASGNPTPYTNGIHAISSGSVTVTFAGDRANAPVTFPVVAGTYYPYAICYMYPNSTAMLLGLL